MTKRIIIIAICTMLKLGAQAKSMSEIWANLPNSAIPYLDRAHRMQMTQYIKMGLKGDVDHSLAGKCVMDTLTSDYIHVTLNESVVMEMKKLPYADADSLLCVVTTWMGPAEESTVCFFSQDWEAFNLPHAFDGKDMIELADEMIWKPDTMESKRFGELRSMIDPVMVRANLAPDNYQLRIRLAMPLLCAADKKTVSAITNELILLWNGSSFQKMG